MRNGDSQGVLSGSQAAEGLRSLDRAMAMGLASRVAATPLMMSPGRKGRAVVSSAVPQPMSA